MIKIGIGSKSLVLTKKLNKDLLMRINKSKVVVYVKPTYSDIQKFITKARYLNIKTHIFICESPKKYFKKIEADNTHIDAAGGLVVNEKNQILFIFRNGKWDLPKGKVEKGEKINKAAVREVEEECGIVISKQKELIIKTYHTYSAKKKNILKSNYWYLMQAPSSCKLIPQEEEGITKCVWVEKSEIPILLKNSYNSIKDVINAYFENFQ